MSDVAETERGTRLFAPVTIAVLLAVGIASFVAMLVLGAYAPDLGGGGSGGGHALSRSFNGFAGIVQLAEATGRHPRIERDLHTMRTEDLVIATPETGHVSLDPVLGPRGSLPTLVVLPKWLTAADQAHRGWAWVQGLRAPGDAAATLAPAATLEVVQKRSNGRALRTVEAGMPVAFAAPRPLQAIRPTRGGGAYGALEPLVVDADGDIVVGRFAGRPLYVLADPDLLDNRALADPRTAAAALAMLDWMNSNQASGIAFDVSLNGFARGRSPLRLLFEPPFLAPTLTLAAAVLLAALGTVARFGSPRPRTRAIALGKTALIDNTAALVRRAGRETRLGGRYAEVMRDAAARRFALPARLRGAALDDVLDRIGPVRFTDRAAAVADAQGEGELVAAAQGLRQWLRQQRLGRTR